MEICVGIRNIASLAELYFPGKDVSNLVLSRKDPLWKISGKVACFSQQANTASWLLVCLISTAYANLCRFSKHHLMS